MCNLYSNLTTHEATRRLVRVSQDRDRTVNQSPLPAIFPRYEAPVVCVGEDGEREVRMMHWGFLMPQVSKKTGKPILPKAVNNARDDKLRSSPFWRGSFQDRRCLVPATSFCEAKGRNPATYYWFGLVGDEDRPPRGARSENCSRPKAGASITRRSSGFGAKRVCSSQNGTRSVNGTITTTRQ
ncbi:MAG: SOS response-associated peptidase family protein [Pseudomonadota bacterium]